MNTDIKEIYLTKAQIHNRVEELAQQLTKEYAGRKLLMISVLKGSFVFLSDLMRQMKIPVFVDFIAVSSYGSGKVSSGIVNIQKDAAPNLSGYDVLIIEDILDSGQTLAYIRDLISGRGAESVRLCVLLDKPCRRSVDITADYVGFSVPDEFLVGYGLDYDERYRNIPYIGILKADAAVDKRP